MDKAWTTPSAACPAPMPVPRAAPPRRLNIARFRSEPDPRGPRRTSPFSCGGGQPGTWTTAVLWAAARRAHRKGGKGRCSAAGRRRFGRARTGIEMGDVRSRGSEAVAATPSRRTARCGSRCACSTKCRHCAGRASCAPSGRRCATGARSPGFRVVHYSIRDDHAHFLVEASGARRLANGMKSLAARFARWRSALERAQALPAASPPGSAGGSGRREFGSVVRRLEGARSAAGAQPR